MKAREGAVAIPATNAPAEYDRFGTRIVDRLIDQQPDPQTAADAVGQGPVA